MNMQRRNRLTPFWRTILGLSLLALLVGVAPVLGQDAEPTVDPALGNLSPGIPDPEEPVTVTFASWVAAGDETNVWQQLGQQFNELHPNITIEFQDVPAEEMRTKLLTQVAANNPPDVAFMDMGTVGEFASRGALVDLTPYIEQSNAVDIDDYVQAFLTGVQYEGGIYGLPIDTETTGLFYRTDLFEAAGIENPPATWEEFREAAEKLTNLDARQYGFILFAPESAYYWYPFLWQAGGSQVDENGDIAFDSDAGQRAADFYVGLRDFTPQDFWSSNSWDGRVAFANGTVAMYIAGSWFAGQLMSEFPEINGKWATAPLPQDERCATTIASDNLVIFSASDNPEAAWKWIEFISAPENMRLVTLGTPDNPGALLLPPRQSILDDPTTYEGPNEILRGFADNMQCAILTEVLPVEWPEVETALNDALGRAIYGEITGAEAVRQAAEEARTTILND